MKRSPAGWPTSGSGRGGRADAGPRRRRLAHRQEVLAGIEDGTVDGYYELQQEMMVNSGAITEEEKCPVSDYVNYDIITEAGNY